MEDGNSPSIEKEGKREKEKAQCFYPISFGNGRFWKFPHRLGWEGVADLFCEAVGSFPARGGARWEILEAVNSVSLNPCSLRASR